MTRYQKARTEIHEQFRADYSSLYSQTDYAKDNKGDYIDESVQLAWLAYRRGVQEVRQKYDPSKQPDRAYVLARIEEGGKPRFGQNPYMHATQEGAEKEANRLLSTPDGPTKMGVFGLKRTIRKTIHGLRTPDQPHGEVMPTSFVIPNLVTNSPVFKTTPNMQAHAAFNELFKLSSPAIDFRDKWADGSGFFANAASGVHAPMLIRGSLASALDEHSERRMVFVGLSAEHNIVLFERHPKGQSGTIACNVPSPLHGYQDFHGDFYDVTGVDIKPRLGNLTFDDIHAVIRFLQPKQG